MELSPSKKQSDSRARLLVNDVRRVGQRARRLLLWQAALWAFAITIGIGFLISICDYWLRLDHWLLLVLASILWAGSSLVAVVGLLRGPLRASYDEAHVASWIERHHPEFRERLSSGVTFARKDDRDATAGALELRQSVVRDAIEIWAHIDAERLLNRRGLFRAIGASAGVLLVLVPLVFVYPEMVATGMLRRITPWSGAGWPTTHKLVFADLPAHVNAGDDVVFRVRDSNHTLPDRVTIVVRYLGSHDSSTMRLNAARTGTVMQATLRKVARSFKVRAIGGDDRRMKWHDVAVVDAPRLADLQLQISPPEYTGEPATTAAGHFQAREGSRITLEGQADRPLRAANLIVRSSDGSLMKLPLRIERDRVTVRLAKTSDGSHEWIVRDSGSYSVLMLDQQNVTGEHAEHSFSVLDDRPPDAELRSPIDEMLAGTASRIDVHGRVEDDLAIERVSLRFTRSDRADAAETVVVVPSREQRRLQGADNVAVDRRVVESVWDLSLIDDLRPETELTLRLSVEDSASQVGFSLPRQVRIVDNATLLRWYQHREQEILARLWEIADRQETAVEDLDDIRGSVRARAHDHFVESLTQLRATQVRVVDSIERSPDSVGRSLRSLYRRVSTSGTNTMGLIERLERSIAILQSLENPCERLIQNLESMRIDAERSEHNPLDGRIHDLLADCVPLQAEVLDALRLLQGNFRDALAAQETLDELQRLLKDQQHLLDETRVLSRLTISQDLDELADDVLKRIEMLADKELALARRTESVFARMADSESRSLKSDPAMPLQRALELASESAISSKMRAASDHVRWNRVRRSIQIQAEIVSQLTRIHGLLSPESRLQEAGNPVDAQIERLLTRQTSLLADAKNLGQQADAQGMRIAVADLAADQASLTQDTSALADSRRWNRTLAWALDQSVREMQRAMHQLRPPVNRSMLIEHQQRAVDALRLILEALRPERGASEPGSSTSTTQPGDSSSSDISGQVRLLIVLQKQLNARCLELRDRSDGLNPRDKQELELLGLRQGELADLLRQITMDGPVP